jgi:alpha-galactosidase
MAEITNKHEDHEDHEGTNLRVPRRDLLRWAATAPLWTLARHIEIAARAEAFDRAAFARAPGRVVSSGGDSIAAVRLDRTWSGDVCRSRLTNTGSSAVRIERVVLFDVPHDLPASTRLYGEGFQMLSQTGGTLGQPLDLGNYTDVKHYKLAEPEGARTLYGLLTLTPSADVIHAVAFGSCRRFNGLFNLHSGKLEVIVDAEGRTLDPGAEWELEEVVFLSGRDRETLLDRVAERVNANHPPRRVKAPPSGWCSWYCFGPNVTATQVLDNLDVIAKQIPGLRYIQIDDGYQPRMGDWLETGTAFGGNVQDVLRQIRTRGFEPAIWVAPFVAEKDSHLFEQHPDWFVKDDTGAPLRSDRVTFGGWRRGPWYVVDGTHPEAQAHLEQVFRTMREDWGCTYFKLDANFWGAIHGGRFHDARATRIEAYRRGMQAIIRGAGDAFILGCNHPIWASTGLVHGSRSSNDIKRTWDRIATTGRQNLFRNWQNGRLWWNDPDAVVLTGDLSDEEFRFHASVIYATGGMVLSGDDLTTISAERMTMLRKLQPPSSIAARFNDDSLRAGTLTTNAHTVACFFNWDETPQTLALSLAGPHRMRDFWTDADRGQHAGGTLSQTLPPRTARLLVCTPGRDRPA